MILIHITQVAAWTKEKRNVMVIIPLDPEQRALQIVPIRSIINLFF